METQQPDAGGTSSLTAAPSRLVLEPRSQLGTGRILVEPGSVLLRPLGSPPAQRRPGELANSSSRQSAPSNTNSGGGRQSDDAGTRLSEPSQSALRTTNFGGGVRAKETLPPVLIALPKSTKPVMPKSKEPPLLSSTKTGFKAAGCQQQPVAGGGLSDRIGRLQGLGLTGGR